MVAKRYGARPSGIIGIGDDALRAFDFDVTVAHVADQYVDEQRERRRREQEDPWECTPDRIIENPIETPEQFSRRIRHIRQAFGQLENVGVQHGG